MNKAALSVEEFRRELGLGKNLAYELARQPGFPAIKVNRKILIPRKGLEQWLEDNQGKTLLGK